MGSSLRQRSFHERFRKCLRISLTFLFSQVGLIALVVAYSAAGAVLFEWLEADQEIEPRRKILQIRLDCLERLRRLTTVDSNDTQWSTSAAALLKGFETQVVKATKEEGYDGKEVDDEERQWSVSGSLLYSITVITTIGYGNLAPKTGPGKLVTMLYALIGIPLMLLCLSNLGSFMASSFQFAFGKIYCCFWCSSRCCCDRRRRRRQRRLSLAYPGLVLSKLATDGPPTADSNHHIQQSGGTVRRDASPFSSGASAATALGAALMVAKREEEADRDSVAECDLAELTERDYDIVPRDRSLFDRQQLSRRRTAKTSAEIAETVAAAAEAAVDRGDEISTPIDRSGQQQQQQQQQRQSRKPTRQQQVAVLLDGSHIGMDRLNQDARSVLADCSRYFSDNNSPGNSTTNGLQPDSTIPATAAAAAKAAVLAPAATTTGLLSLTNDWNGGDRDVDVVGDSSEPAGLSSSCHTITTSTTTPTATTATTTTTATTSNTYNNCSPSKMGSVPAAPSNETIHASGTVRAIAASSPSDVNHGSVVKSSMARIIGAATGLGQQQQQQHAAQQQHALELDVGPISTGRHHHQPLLPSPLHQQKSVTMFGPPSPPPLPAPLPPPLQPHQQQRVPVSVVMAFLVGYICLGAAVFSAWEEWSYLDGAYFSFITLSTIGFGDLVPGSKVLEQGQTKLVACIVYLVVGLAMIAMSFNLVQEEVITQFQRLGQNMGILDEK